MTIQQTIQSLTKDLSHHEAAELDALIQDWPVNDHEFQDLIEKNTGAILRLFQQSQPSPQPEQAANGTVGEGQFDLWVA